MNVSEASGPPGPRSSLRTFGKTLTSQYDHLVSRSSQLKPLSPPLDRRTGNVRELENVIERAMMMTRGDRITARDLPRGIVAPSAPDGEADDGLNLKRSRRALEIDLIRLALRATGGNRTHAAKRLGISHRALLYKLKEYGIRD